MTREVILHAGMHKTGSTAIQRQLNGRETEDFRYADLGLSNHSVTFLKALRKDPELFERSAGRPLSNEELLGQIDESRKKITNELEKPFKRLMFSAEELSRLDRHALVDLRNMLSHYCDRIRVIAYVREPVAFASSALQQRIKDGQRGYQLVLPDYKQRFAGFVEVFGRRACEFLPYDPARLDGGSVVSDICSRLEIEDLSPERFKVNRGLPLEAIQFLHMLNRVGPIEPHEAHRPRVRTKMISQLHGLFSTPFVLSQDIVR